MIDWVKLSNNQTDYIIDYSKTKEIKMAALDAAIFTIEYIHKHYPPPYTLFLSGGVDSQAMLYAWLQSGKKFDTYSGIFNFDLNLHDLESLKIAADLWGITINFQKFNLFKFLHEEYEMYANLYRCGSPHICSHMKMAETVKDGTAIFSGNFIVEGRFIDKNVFGLYKYGKISNKPIVPFFLCETEELAYSFIHTHFNKSIDINDYNHKVSIYKNNGFPVIPQDKKITGFEKVKEYYDINFDNPCKNKFEYYLTVKQRSTRIFDLLYRNKYEWKFRQDKYLLKDGTKK
jgi:hypothetical protein